jgi:hypothetical protein
VGNQTDTDSDGLGTLATPIWRGRAERQPGDQSYFAEDYNGFRTATAVGRRDNDGIVSSSACPFVAEDGGTRLTVPGGQHSVASVTPGRLPSCTGSMQFLCLPQR